MVTENQKENQGTSSRFRLALWFAAGVVLMALLAVLTVAIESHPDSSLDSRMLNWISGWEFPGLTGLFELASFLTNNWPGLGLALATMIYLWVAGLRRESKALFVIWIILGFVVYLGDATLGEWVGRGRPFASANDHPSYPSGHVFGSTVPFGFWLFLANHYGLKPKWVLVASTFLIGFLLLVGASRVYLQEHWPSDVVAGYLLGALWLLILIPLYLYLREAPWFFQGEDSNNGRATAPDTRK
jgi:membrane-associated phospholipid phosphatase